MRSASVESWTWFNKRSLCCSNSKMNWKGATTPTTTTTKPASTCCCCRCRADSCQFSTCWETAHTKRPLDGDKFQIHKLLRVVLHWKCRSGRSERLTSTWFCSVAPLSSWKKVLGGPKEMFCWMLLLRRWIGCGEENSIYSSRSQNHFQNWKSSSTTIIFYYLD